MNLNVPCKAQWIELGQHHEFNANRDSVDDRDTFPDLEHLEYIADS